MAKGWTFQSLIDAKMTVTAHCHHGPCNHNQVLDLARVPFWLKSALYSFRLACPFGLTLAGYCRPLDGQRAIVLAE